MERILASIVMIDNVAPIPGADHIEVATVKGWKLVIRKGEYQPGDAAIYCEIDSFLPVTPAFEFLRKSSYRKMGETEGFRLKTIKLRGQISQGLLLPVDILNGHAYTLGEDVTARLGIIKYEAPIPASLAGIMKVGFPSFIPKTDEERIQNLSDQYHTYRSNPCRNPLSGKALSQVFPVFMCFHCFYFSFTDIIQVTGRTAFLVYCFMWCKLYGVAVPGKLTAAITTS